MGEKVSVLALGCVYNAESLDGIGVCCAKGRIKEGVILRVVIELL
jgi:hypothetical protein